MLLPESSDLIKSLFWPNFSHFFSKKGQQEIFELLWGHSKTKGHADPEVNFVYWPPWKNWKFENFFLKVNICKLSFFHLIIGVRFPYVHLTAQIFILNNLFCLFIFLWFFYQNFCIFFSRFWWLSFRKNWRGSTQAEIYFQ